MRREEWLAMLLEISLIGIKHTIQPGQKLLCAVIGVENNWDTIQRSNRADIVSSGNSTANRCGLVAIGNSLASEISSPTLTGLKDDWGLFVAGSLKSSNYCGR